MAPPTGTLTSRASFWGMVSFVIPMSCFSNEAFAKTSGIFLARRRGVFGLADRNGVLAWSKAGSAVR